MAPTSKPLAPDQRIIPEKPTVDGLEEHWGAVWSDEQTYAFDATKRGMAMGFNVAWADQEWKTWDRSSCKTAAFAVGSMMGSMGLKSATEP